MTYKELQDSLKEKRDQIAVKTFPTAEKETFRQELIQICDYLLAIPAPSDFGTMTKEEYVSYVGICIKWAERLLLAYEYRLNPEMSFCIESLVLMWNIHKEKKLVIFTLGDFQILKIKREDNKDDIDYLETLRLHTGVQQTYEPVFIRVPDIYKGQMLTNVPLFHEVGHFVDKDNSLSDLVFDIIEDDLKISKTSRFLREHFPRFINVDLKGNDAAEKIIKAHISEYIADLFGAQYSHEYILLPAKYVTTDPSKDDDKHPSLDCRRRFVNVFLDYCKTGATNNPLLKAILETLGLVNNVALVDEVYTIAELLSDSLIFNDINELLSAFYIAWKNIILESKKAKILGKTSADYQKILNLPRFKQLDENIRKATSTLVQP